MKVVQVSQVRHPQHGGFKVLFTKEGKKTPYKNKMWKKDADESKSFTKKELNALVKKIVSEGKKSWGKDRKKGDNKCKNDKVNTVEMLSEEQASISSNENNGKDISQQMTKVDALLASMEMAKIKV
jgi:hypothetical protein